MIRTLLQSRPARLLLSMGGTVLSLHLLGWVWSAVEDCPRSPEVGRLEAGLGTCAPRGAPADPGEGPIVEPGQRARE